MSKPDPRLILLVLCIGLFLFISSWSYLPLIDLPNHIARYHISTANSSALDEFYTYTFSTKANAAVDMLWLGIGRHLTDPVRFANICMAFYAANFLISVSVLSRVVHGGWSIWPLAAAIFVFNVNFLYGFQNYLFSVPFAFYFLAVWLYIQNYSALKKILILTVPAFVLFQMHILAFAIVLFAVFGYEVDRLLVAPASKRWTLFKTNIVAAVPLFLPCLHYLADRIGAPPNVYGSLTFYGSIVERFWMILSPLLVGFIKFDAVLVTIAFFLLVCFYSILVNAFISRQSKLRLAPHSRGPLLVFMILFFVMPRNLDGAAVISHRYPFVFFSLFFAFSSWSKLKKRQVVLYTTVFVSLFAYQVTVIAELFNRNQQEVTELQALFEDLLPGARVLSVRDSQLMAERRYAHAPGYLVVFADSYVPTLFQGTHGLSITPEWKNNATPVWGTIPSVMVFRPDIAIKPYVTASRHVYWSQWQDKFTHVLAMGQIPDENLKYVDIQCWRRVGDFTLYLTKAGAADPRFALGDEPGEGCETD
ncbi:hypothetical protein [Pacificibacter sp.]|uniref:hypothetical protein n=1 Tax=Pacificibacter sp. TaxID=1917866 RepID=UPI00321A9130